MSGVLSILSATATADSSAPTLQSATINSAGTTLTLGFSESVQIGAGGSGGVVLTSDYEGTMAATYSSGTGTASLVFTIVRRYPSFPDVVASDETCTLAYTQPGSGIEDMSGNDLASFSGTATTNNSSVTIERYWADPSWGGTQSGTSAEPYNSAQAALAAKCNKTFTAPIQIRLRTSSSTVDSTRLTDNALTLMEPSSSNRLQFKAESGSRVAAAAWDASKYTFARAFTSTQGAGLCVWITNEYVHIDGVQLEVTSQAGQDAACEIVYLSAANTMLSNFNIRGTNNADTSRVTRGISVVNGAYLVNGIIYAIGGGGSPNGSECIQSHVGGTFYNLTLIDTGGIATLNLDDGTYTVTNVYAGGTPWFTNINDESTTTMSYTATRDTSATGTGSIDSVPTSTATFTNVTQGSEDWSLAGGSQLEGTGTNVSGGSWPLNVNTDITGAARGASWSIGAAQT